MQKKVAIIVPIYPPHFKRAKSLLESFKKHKLDKQADLWFVFTNEEEKKEFVAWDNSIILPKELCIFANNGIINIKKIYALKYLTNNFNYQYSIILDAETKFLRNIDLIEVCDSYFNKKELYGNLVNKESNFLTERVKQQAKSYYLACENISLLDTDYYLWFNQPCIYNMKHMGDFFLKIKYNENISQLKWEDFDYYLYMYYLILFQDFKIVDVGIIADYGAFEVSPSSIKILNNSYKDLDIYICSNSLLNLFYNDKLFIVSHCDRGMNTSVQNNGPSLSAKKIVFVAHEFGLFRGHGGIASYLYNMCNWLLKATNHKIYVFAQDIDPNCDLLENPNFTMTKLSGNLIKARNFVYKQCKSIMPDYVEFAEFGALGLFVLKNKNEFLNTVLVTNNHTATKEIYEWCELKNFSQAPEYMKQIAKEEAEGLKLSDYCIAPSKFLAKYVEKNYNLEKPVLHFANPFFMELKSKFIIREELEQILNISDYDKTFNIVLITRFENRKCHKRLLDAFIKLVNEGLDLKLILAGNTSFSSDNKDCRAQLYYSIPENYRKYVEIYDFLDLQAQEKLIAIADLVVMPSTFENQPVAMVETVMRGIPVMGSVYSGIADYSDEMLLFNPFIDDDLTLKIRNFMNLSKEEKTILQQKQYKQLFDEINPEKSILNRICLEKDLNLENKLLDQDSKLNGYFNNENYNFLEDRVCSLHF